MSNCPSREDLRQYLVGGGSHLKSRLEFIEDHVERCEECQDLLGRLTQDEVPEGATAPDLSPHGYRVYRILGSGTYGEVWLAQDLNLPRVVALKTLRWCQGLDRQPSLIDALRNEAHLLTGLEHPNLVRLHAWLTTRDSDYLVMQYVPGGSLRDLLQEVGPLDWQRAAGYIADVGDGLLKAHSRGIVHRDVKPANILLDPQADEALLTDFGIGARLGDPATIGGSLPYMAPEAFDGRIAPSLDVYSLAATLFQLITGTPPFAGPAAVNYRDQAAQGLPASDPRLRNLPEPLERVIRRGLHPGPGSRSDLLDFLEDLRGSLNQLSADRLAAPPSASAGPAPVNLRLNISRQVEPGRFETIQLAPARSVPLTRDIRRVPTPPTRVLPCTGDRLRLELITDRDGYVTVFNVGPTGNLNLLFPEAEDSVSEFVAGGRPLSIGEVELGPPAGRERIFAVWSKSPRLLAELHLFGQGNVAASRPYIATRDLKRVQAAMQGAARQDCHAFVLELDHVG